MNDGTKRVLGRIELWVRRYPIAIFQISVFALHHETWLAWILLAAAPFADRHFRRLEIVDDWLSEIWKVLRFVEKHSTCGYRRFDLSVVIDQDTFSRYQGQIISKQGARLENWFRGLIRARPIEAVIVERTRLFTVSRERSMTRPGPSSFMTDIGGYIFLTEAPVNIKGVYRFYLLHELGHLSPYSKYTWRRGRRGGTPFFGLFYWVLPQVLLPHFGGLTLFVVFIDWFAITIFRDVHWYIMRRFGLVIDEIYADLFAYLALNRQELVRVADFFKHWPVPPDPTIPTDDPYLQKMDAFRRDILGSHFKEARKYRGKVRGYFGVPQYAGTEWQVWICFAIGAAFVPLTNAASCNGVAVAGGLSFVTIYLFWSFWRQAHLLESRIDRVLAGAPSVPADVVTSWPAEPWSQKQLRRLLGYEAAPLTSHDKKSLIRWYAESLPISIALATGLMLVTLLNAIPSQSYCL
jgi:hypothetical protein